MFNKKELQFGDIVTLRSGTKAVVSGKRINFEDGEYNVLDEFEDNLTNIYKFKNLDIIKIERFVLEDNNTQRYLLIPVYERKEEILDKEEKEYLSAVIKPFRNRIKSITKLNAGNEEWIYFNLNRENRIDDFPLPTFKKGIMYKEMESNKEYSLKELGLED